MSTCEPCKVIAECLQFPLEFYNLNVGKHYSNPLMGFQVVQPDGSVLTVYVPPGTINLDFPFPPDFPGEYPPVVLKCPGGGTIVRVVPSGSTQAQIDAIIAEMILLCATEIANKPKPPGTPQPPNPQTNDIVFFNFPCESGTITLSVTPPSWISLDVPNSRLVGAAGTFNSNSKAAANATAQAALDGWANQQIGLGTLTCVVPFDCGVTPQSVQDAVWTQEAGSPCGLFAIAGGSGSWSLTRNNTTCLVSTVGIETFICNPGDAYNIDLDIPWDDSGDVAAGIHTITLSLNIDGINVDAQTKDLATGPFTPFALSGTLITEHVSHVEIFVTVVGLPALPSNAFEVHGTISITPLVPP